MNQIETTVYFLSTCLLFRLLIAFLVKWSDVKWYPYYSIIAIIPAIVWVFLYSTNSRKIGIEVLNSSKQIWWNNYRIVHAINYFIFSYLSLSQNSNAYLILLFDVFVGLFAHFQHYYF